MHPELITLEDAFNSSRWLTNHDLEPVVGHPTCHRSAEKYGIRGRSCCTAFVEDKEDATYGCQYERCWAFLTHSLDDAVGHLRCHHFDHRPFLCIPPRGRPWYDPLPSIHCPFPFFLLYPRRKFTHVILTVTTSLRSDRPTEPPATLLVTAHLQKQR